MITVILATAAMVAILGIVHHSIGVIGTRNLQPPLLLSMGAVCLMSGSMYLTPVPANILRSVIVASILFWFIYTVIVAQIEPQRRSSVRLSDDQKNKIRDLAKEILAKEGSDFDVDERVKPVVVHHPLDTDAMMPIPSGTEVSTPEGDGIVELFIPTLEMVHNSEEFRNVKGYRVRMGDNNIRYFKATEVNQK
jgi:hypothetical protein